ncbi:hypothetical protein HAX54_043315 [Datura stramonium]|uniref:Uncharacterized protein n=1 Tax=Datura stramonium TaxID=4076 RepID=A0ABS8W271_DATST|nr:hypothetical protein [Datura stramonium]
MDHLINDYPLLKEEHRRNSRKQQQLASKAFKKAMKATWSETSYAKSEREDGENDNLALMDRSDTDSERDSTELSLSDMKTQDHELLCTKVKDLHAQIERNEEVVAARHIVLVALITGLSQPTVPFIFSTTQSIFDPSPSTS